MPKKSSKSLSKRMKLKDKFKAVKRKKEALKKQAKDSKKQERRSTSVLRDPGVPGNYPYRDQVIKELKFEHQRILAQRMKAREDKRKQPQEIASGRDDSMADIDDTDALAALRENADALNSTHDMDEDMVDNQYSKTRERAFFKDIKKVADLSDVILEVLDARDPCSCRCKDVERHILKLDPNKRIILVLNKVDLIPPQNVMQWLSYLREELPTVACKASTKKKGSIKQSKFPRVSQSATGASPLDTSECLGIDALMQLLKNYSRNGGLKTSITVGVIGIPNVGKSSLINSMMRNCVSPVGNAPGVTRTVQEVHLDKNIRLLDSPGLATSAPSDLAAAALYSGTKVEQIGDSVAAVSSILDKVESRTFMHLYNIGAFTDCQDMLRKVAVSRGKLQKGGIANVNAAATMVLSDWRDGKIPFHTLPPSRGNESVENPCIITSYSKEFQFSDLHETDSQILSQLEKMETAV